MNRNIQKYGLVNLLTLLFVGGVAFGLTRYCKALSGQVSVALLGIGFLVAVVSWFQMRLEERERLEKLEFDELLKGRERSALFQTPDAEAFPAQHAREQFERFFVPIFTILLVIVQGGAAWLVWQWVKFPQTLNHPVVMSMFAVFALWLFLLGRYTASIARLEGHRLLRAGAGYLLLCAYLCFIVLVVGVGLVQVGVPNADFYVARGQAVLLGLIAIETLVNLVLEIYRPRIKGKPGRPIYESRLVGLLGHPEGLITTAAQALDYQFGFKVSETWFYQFLEKRLGTLLLFQLAVLLLSTCVVFLDPGEKGLLERFGQQVQGRPVLEPGPHLKLPWPIDRVHRFATAEVQSFNIGAQPDPKREGEKTILWTVPHYKEEFNLLVASRDAYASTNQAPSDQAVPVNLLSASIPVQYEISDVRAWAYNHSDASNVLEKIATREVVRYFVGVDMVEVMSKDRLKAANELRDRIQSGADELRLGARVLLVGLQDIHPPTKVAATFEQVVSAQQEVEARILEAQGAATGAVLQARAEAVRKMADAEAAKIQRVTSAAAVASQFTNQIVAFNAAPKVYPQRLYYQALINGSAHARKYIIATTNAGQVIQLDLQDKLRPDLMDVTVPASR